MDTNTYRYGDIEITLWQDVYRPISFLAYQMKSWYDMEKNSQLAQTVPQSTLDERAHQIVEGTKGQDGAMYDVGISLLKITSHYSTFISGYWWNWNSWIEDLWKINISKKSALIP